MACIIIKKQSVSLDIVVLCVNKVSLYCHRVHAMPVEHSVNVCKLIIQGDNFNAGPRKVACWCCID